MSEPPRGASGDGEVGPPAGGSPAGGGSEPRAGSVRADGLSAGAGSGPPAAGGSEPLGAVPPAGSPGPRPTGRRGSGISWLVGIAVVAALAYITYNTARTDAPGARGLPAGTRLPPFAAPVATSGLQGDANVAVERTGAAPRACDVRGADVVNACALAERGPVVLAFVAVRPASCLDVVGAIDAAARRVPRAGFAVVAIRGGRKELGGIVRRRGWRIPVAHDRDGAVANAYGVGVCPTVFFADRGGIIRSTTYGALRAADVRRRAEQLE